MTEPTDCGMSLGDAVVNIAIVIFAASVFITWIVCGYLETKSDREHEYRMKQLEREE